MSQSLQIIYLLFFFCFHLLAIISRFSFSPDALAAFIALATLLSDTSRYTHTWPLAIAWPLHINACQPLAIELSAFSWFFNSVQLSQPCFRCREQAARPQPAVQIEPLPAEPPGLERPGQPRIASAELPHTSRRVFTVQGQDSCHSCHADYTGFHATLPLYLPPYYWFQYFSSDRHCFITGWLAFIFVIFSLQMRAKPLRRLLAIIFIRHWMF